MCRNGLDATMRTLPLWPPVKLFMGPRNVWAVCRNGRDATPCHWGPGWSSLWGHAAWQGCAETGVTPHPVTGALCGARYEATKLGRGVPKRACRHDENPATGAFGEALYGAMKRVRGVKQAWRHDANPAIGALAGTPHRGHELCERCAETGVTPTFEPCHWGIRWRPHMGPRNV